MKFPRATLWYLVIALVQLAPSAQSQEPPRAESTRQAGALQLNEPVESEIGPGQTDVYAVSASAGELLHIVLQKKGVNAVVTIAGPDGNVLIVADDPAFRAFGTAPASAVASAEGQYQIRVSKSPRTAESGRYQIELTSLRLPTDQDLADLKAETIFYAAVQNERAQTKENRLKAIAGYQQAAALWKAMHDDDHLALCLYRIGVVDRTLGDFDGAIAAMNQALPLWRSAKDATGEAITLTGLGYLLGKSGKISQGFDNLHNALLLERAAGDRECQASTLQLDGLLLSDSGSEAKAIDFYYQSLALFRSLGDRQNQSYLLTGIGLAYQELGENLKALDSFRESLALNRALNDKYGEAGTLTNIGLTHRELGDDQTALVSFKQALQLFQAIGDRHGETFDLYDIGLSYSNLGNNSLALTYARKALPVATAIDDRGAQALVHELLGSIYGKLGRWQPALEQDRTALALSRVIDDRPEQTWELISLGQVYTGLGARQKSTQQLIQALGIACQDANLSQQSVILGDLMVVWQHAANPALAIFYGKKAINLFQQMRANLQGAGDDLEKQFLSSNDDRYRTLANLLIDQGRLAEAQQVLNLLKRQEYKDYVRGNAADTVETLALTPDEQHASDDYQKATTQMVKTGEQWAALKDIPNRAPEQEKQFQQLSADLEAGNRGLNDYFARLYLLLGKNPQANRQVADVKSDVSALRDEIGQTPHAVALYTIVSGDRYRVIMITPSATVVREFIISQADLNRRISAFQQALRDPASDPKPLAHDLYNIVVRPISKDLDQASAHTLVWSLDGALRFIPISALYDGSHYLVENYNIVTITPAGIARLNQNPNVEDLNAVAMGISRRYENDLIALPAVEAELDDIVKDPAVRGADGVLPGSILLNDQFTEKAMENQLGGKRSVVHIASHFVLEPGDDTRSYLLLAGKDSDSNGYHLTLADFRDNQNLSLHNTDLLTLSACETGVTSNAGNGREVDGLATTAMLKGARAVISSLWDVNDSSTGILMADFYRRWADGGGKVPKVEALRMAQLDLLKSKAAPHASNAGRESAAVGTESQNQLSPSGYAHPYFWAAFVLTGNWR